jgi:hypothetical protein
MSDSFDRESPESFVNRQIGRVSRNLLLWNGIVVGLAAMIVLLLWFYLGWFFHGPQLVDDAYILNAAKGPPSSLIAYIELRDRKLIPTGYVEESSRNGKVYSSMSYYFVEVGDKWMLIKATTDAQGQRLIGPLESISGKADQQAEDAIIAKSPAARNRILPVMLNASAAFNVFGYVLLGILTPILALCGYNMARAVIRQGKTRIHPVTRALARQGDPIELARVIDAELAEENVLRVGKAIITRNWLLRPTFFRLIACRLDEIVWAFHAVISGDNVATFAFRNGRIIGVPLHRNTPELLASIYQRFPWVEKGWDRDKAKKWRSQRAAFLAAVDSRRKERKG